jgi:hypothetical protein
MRRFSLILLAFFIIIIRPAAAQEYVYEQINTDWLEVCNVVSEELGFEPYPGFLPEIVEGNEWYGPDETGAGGCSFMVQSENVVGDLVPSTPSDNYNISDGVTHINYLVDCTHVGISDPDDPLAGAFIWVIAYQLNDMLPGTYLADQYNVDCSGQDWQRPSIQIDAPPGRYFTSAYQGFRPTNGLFGNNVFLFDRITIHAYGLGAPTPTPTATPGPTHTPTIGPTPDCLNYATSFVSCDGPIGCDPYTYDGVEHVPDGGPENVVGDVDNTGYVLYHTNPGTGLTCLAVDFGQPISPGSLQFYWSVSLDNRGGGHTVALAVWDVDHWEDVANPFRGGNAWYGIDTGYSGPAPFQQARVCSEKITTGVQGYPHIDAFRAYQCGLATVTPTATISGTATATLTATPVPTELVPPTATPGEIPTQVPVPTATPYPVPTIPPAGTPIPIPTPGPRNCGAQEEGNYEFCYDYGDMGVDCYVILPAIGLIGWPGFQLCFRWVGIVVKVFGYVVPVYIVVSLVVASMIWRRVFST